MSPITINFMSEELWEAHKPENLQTSHTDTEKDKPEHNHCWLSQELHLSIYQLLRPTEKMTKHALNILFSCCGKLTLKTLIALKISRVQILHLRDCEASKLTQTHITVSQDTCGKTLERIFSKCKDARKVMSTGSSSSTRNETIKWMNLEFMKHIQRYKSSHKYFTRTFMNSEHWISLMLLSGETSRTVMSWH